MSISRRLIASMLVLHLVAWGCSLNARAGGMGGMGSMGGMVGGRGRGGNGNNKNYVPPDEAPKVNPFASDSLPTIGVQARLDALEKFVLGKTTKNSLEVRAQHLEKKLV